MTVYRCEKQRSIKNSHTFESIRPIHFAIFIVKCCLSFF